MRAVSHACTPLLSLPPASSSEEPTSCGDVDPRPRGPSWDWEWQHTHVPVHPGLQSPRRTGSGRGGARRQAAHAIARELPTGSHKARQGPRAPCLNTVHRAAVTKGHRASSCTAGPDVCAPGPAQTRHAESSDGQAHRKESKNRVRGSARSCGPSGTKWEQRREGGRHQPRPRAPRSLPSQQQRAHPCRSASRTFLQ